MVRKDGRVNVLTNLKSVQVRLGPCLHGHHHQLQKMKPPSGDLDTPTQTAEAPLPGHTEKTSADEQFQFSQTFSFYDFFVFEFGFLHFSITVKCNSKQGLSLLLRWSHETFIILRAVLNVVFNILLTVSKSTPGDVGTH